MARLVEEHQEDFSRGMDDSRVANRYPNNAARLILNGRVEPDGTISRRDGNRRKNALVLNADTGYGGVLFETAGGDQQEIVIFGDTAYMSDDNWATDTPIATDLYEDYYDFATMRIGATNYLFLANGDTTVKRWNGATWDTLPNAPSGVKYIEVFNSRLWVSGHSGVFVQASKVADPTIWTSAGGSLTVQILTHDGDVPTGLFQLGSHLLVFDEDATSYIDGFGEQTLIVAQGATGFSRSVGCIAFRTIRAVGDDGVCWLSGRGVEYYRPSTGIVQLTRPIQSFVNSIDFTRIANARGIPTACYDPIRQNYHCAVPVGSIQNSRTIVVNLYQRGQGWVGAPSIDQQAYTADAELLFGGDADWGPNVATNGTFDSDTSWTKGGGWTISGGKASNPGPVGVIYQNPPELTVNLRHRVTFTVSGLTQPLATINTRVGNLNGSLHSTNGTFVEILTPSIVGPPFNDRLQFFNGSLWNGAIDDVICELDTAGYLAIDAGGFPLRADANGYVTFGTEGAAGDPTIGDGDGYLAVATNDTVSASLYLGPSANEGRVVTSAGYDGFVRQHFGPDFENDDETAAPSGGVAVELTLVPRPFVFRTPRQRKRIRTVHVGAINDAEATIDVAVRAAGVLGTAVPVTIPSTAFDQLRRDYAMVAGDGDTPQIELRTTDRTRIALVGVTAELLREPV